MGRVCKRVALDFEWPIKKTYVGYINPYHSVDCPFCEAGYSPQAQKIKDEVYCQSFHFLPNPYRTDLRYNPDKKEHHMTQDEVDYYIEHLHPNTKKKVDAFMEKEYPNAEKVTPEIFSQLCLFYPFDFTNNLSWMLITYHSEKEGWDRCCSHCHGSGRMWFSEEVEKLHNEWERRDPPVGEGYQIWEDTSEGSPLTPVFKTAEELAEYCEENEVSWFGHETAKKEDWLKLIETDCPAAVEVAPGVIMM